MLKNSERIRIILEGIVFTKLSYRKIVPNTTLWTIKVSHNIFSPSKFSSFRNWKSPKNIGPIIFLNSRPNKDIFWARNLNMLNEFWVQIRETIELSLIEIHHEKLVGRCQISFFRSELPVEIWNVFAMFL